MFYLKKFRWHSLQAIGADIHQNKEIGASFQRYCQQEWIQHGSGSPGFPEEHDVETALDHSKITTLHSQMHHFAMKYPGEEVVFTFIDDREDVLEGLAEFYFAHPKLIPSNVTLKLEQSSPFYQLKPQERFQSAHSKIQGRGLIDTQFAATCRHWMVEADSRLFHQRAEPTQALPWRFLKGFQDFQEASTMYDILSKIPVDDFRSELSLYQPEDLIDSAAEKLKGRCIDKITDYLTQHSAYQGLNIFSNRNAKRDLAKSLSREISEMTSDSFMQNILSKLEHYEKQNLKKSHGFFCCTSGGELGDLLQSIREAVEAQRLANEQVDCVV